MARIKEFDENEVLDKAMGVFWEKGYNSTSAQDLVSELGISRSSLYDTFGDKHSLFVKALKQYQTEKINPVIKGTQFEEDPEAYIRFFFESVKSEALTDNRSKGCFLINSVVELAPIDSEVLNIANTIMLDTEDALYKAIKRGQDKGVFTTKNSAHALARFIFNSLNGLRVTVKFDSTPKMFDDIVKVCLSTLKA